MAVPSKTVTSRPSPTRPLGRSKVVRPWDPRLPRTSSVALMGRQLLASLPRIKWSPALSLRPTLSTRDL